MNSVFESKIYLVLYDVLYFYNTSIMGLIKNRVHVCMFFILEHVGLKLFHLRYTGNGLDRERKGYVGPLSMCLPIVSY